MFLEFFSLREQPFGVTPDPRYLYLGSGHREALASLFYGIEAGRGFVSLIAQPGMGKTTLLFRLLQEWKVRVRSAFIFQTQCDSRELLRYLLEDFGIKGGGQDVVSLHAKLNDFLCRENRAGMRPVVFIDEAQNLSDGVLETVRLLTDLEAPDKKLLQIVLAGQPELGDRLARRHLSQLRQRIAVQTRLDPLAPPEVAQYIQYRLQVAGYEGGELFTPGALRLIAEYSRGIPRLINSICFNAMSLACAMKSRPIVSETVLKAVADLNGESPDLERPIPQPQPQPQTHRRVTPTLARRVVSASLDKMRKQVFPRHVLQRFVLLMLLGGLGLYVGLRGGAAWLKRPPRTPNPSSATLGAGAQTLPRENTSNVALPAPSRSEKAFTYTVEQGDTLHDLCVATEGRYNARVLAKIRALNPDLRNPNLILTGQVLRLPLSEASE